MRGARILAPQFVDMGLAVRPAEAVSVGFGCLAKEALHHVTILELVIHRIALVGAWLLQELVEVIVSGRALILAAGRRDLASNGRPTIVLVLPIITA